MLTKLLKFTKLFDNVNVFTEAEVGDWDLPEEILLAPAGGMEWAVTDPYVDYYGPDGGPIDFASPVDVSGY